MARQEWNHKSCILDALCVSVWPMLTWLGSPGKSAFYHWTSNMQPGVMPCRLQSSKWKHLKQVCTFPCGCNAMTQLMAAPEIVEDRAAGEGTCTEHFWGWDHDNHTISEQYGHKLDLCDSHHHKCVQYLATGMGTKAVRIDYLVSWSVLQWFAFFSLSNVATLAIPTQHLVTFVLGDGAVCLVSCSCVTSLQQLFAFFAHYCVIPH